MTVTVTMEEETGLSVAEVSLGNTVIARHKDKNKKVAKETAEVKACKILGYI